MPLTQGAHFGSYEIAGLLGAGGMGEVYRAHDTSLKRDVAIKVLPASLASDADRLARFQREAEVLASLNHPNIAHIYGIERGVSAEASATGEPAATTTALVMELVEGPTLADRIAEGPIPPEEALHIAMQIADALEAAHARGIVHRDLKPANVKLTPDGLVKVLDFGIAKALDTRTESGAEAAALTTPAMTQAGLILGTAAYMAPEQARGKPVDQRADIWSFGCVLYEMLTGQPAFAGEDVLVTLARVLDRDTNIDSLPGMLSPAVRHTIKLCLEKDPRKRIADVRDVRLALEGRFEADMGSGGLAARPKPARWRRALPVAVTAIVAVVATTLAISFAMRPEPAPVSRFAYTVPRDQPFRATATTVLALSLDGRKFVYNTNAGFYVRSLDELEARVIPGTEEFAASPVFSPDGQSIAYFTRTEIRRIALSGGASVLISKRPSSGAPRGADWTSDDTILFSEGTGVFRVPASGGTPDLVIESGNGEQLYGPQLLPDGDSVLLTAGRPGPGEGNNIVVASLSTGERTTLGQSGSDARYVPTGHLVYALDDGLFAVRFDAKTLRVSGGPVPLVQSVMRATQTPGADYAISHDGTLVYLTGQGGTQKYKLVWVDREGNEEPIDAPPRNYQYVQLSPDGKRLALDARDDKNDIWIWDLGRETLQRLTFDPGMNRVPLWAPDGRVVFSRELEDGEEIYWQAADGSGSPEPLTKGSAEPMVPNDISPDGKVLLYMPVVAPRDIWMTGIGEDETQPRRLIAGPANEYGAQVSPDGRWLAYQSNESGQFEVYVRPFPDVATGRWQISTAGGTRPRWNRDGSELFYYVEQTPQSGALMAVSIAPEPGFQPSAPRMLFEGDYLAPNAAPETYDVSLDGQRFVMIKAADAESETRETQIVVVENWLEELERLAPPE